MKPTPSRTRHLVSVGWFALLLPVSLWAQTTAAPAKDSAPDAPVQLSPFEVTAGTTVGYLAAEATSGTRYATPILETPIAVNTITRDFIEDFQLIDGTGQEMLGFTSSFTFAGGTGAINLRGIRGFAVYKNGIREGGVLGPASLERTEVIKGSSAAIYGQAEPSGMVNRITKKGTHRASYELLVNGGSGRGNRVQVDVDQPLIRNKLLSRFAASYERSEFGAQDFADFKRTNVYGSTTWLISPQTAFTANAEYIWFRSPTQSASALPFVFRPVVINGVSSNQFIGIFGMGDYQAYAHINTNGPNTYNQVEYTQVDGTLSHRVNSWLTARVLGAFWNRNQNQTNYVRSGSNANAYNAATGILQGTQAPDINRNRSTQVNAQTDWLAEFQTGAVSHKVLLTLDYKLNNGYSAGRRTTLPQYSMPLNNFLTGGPVSVAGFPYEYDFRNPVWNVDTGRGANEAVAKGIMVSERLGLFQNRWLILLGGRSDILARSEVDYLSPIKSASTQVGVGEWIDYPTNRVNTYQTGMLYRATPALSVYVNSSSSFLPQGTAEALVYANGNPLDPQRGAGYEGGLKILLLDNRLSLTAGGYELQRTNIPRTARDPAGNALLIPGVTPGTTRQYSTVADVRSKGYEFDANWQPRANLSLTLGVGCNNIRYTRVPNATEQYLLGNRPEGSPAWTGGTTVSYRFTGDWLKGFSVRASLRYSGDALINTGTSSVYGDSGVAGPAVTIGGQQVQQYYFRNHAYTVTGFGATYRWKAGRLNHAITLDVTNLFDKIYLQGAKPANPRGITLGYRLKL